MDVEVYLLPVQQQLEQITIEATLRIRTTPLYRELAGEENDNSINTPLNQLLKVLEDKYNIQLNRLEKRQQYIVPLW